MGKRSNKIRHAFVSYSRDDKVWTYEFAKSLRDELALSVFVDYEIHVGTKWWQVICENIELCDYFIYIMSPRSIESIYCTAEVNYAVSLNKPIFPIMYKPCIYPHTLSQNQIQYLTLTDKMQLPQTLLALQKGFFDVQALIYEGEFVIPNPSPPRPDEPKPKDSQSAEEVYHLAIDAQQSDFDRAIRLFEQVIAADKQGKWGKLATKRLKETKSYQEVVRMLPKSLRDARELWHEHITEFGAEFDPLGVAQQLANTPSPRPQPKPITPPIEKPKPASSPVITPSPYIPSTSDTTPSPDTEAIRLLRELDDINTPHKRRLEIGQRLAQIGDPRQGIGVLPNGIPDISWCFVEKGGNITIEKTKFTIKPFYVAKYLTTNAQYQAFVNAKDGYNNPEWWKLFQKHYRPQKLDEAINPDSNAPRDSLSWYHSIAFALWLDHHYRQNGLFQSVLNLNPADWKISLPPEWYWQWMAQNGSEEREYAWGEWDNAPRANTTEAGIYNQSTAVGMYPHGVAGCGAFDVSGNLWEWCLNDYSNISTIKGYSNNVSKALRGGSFFRHRSLARTVIRNFFNPFSEHSFDGVRVFVLPMRL